MKYPQKTFSAPVSNPKMSDLAYDFAVGKISAEEYERRVKEER
jgi:hypothetical protein